VARATRLLSSERRRATPRDCTFEVTSRHGDSGAPKRNQKRFVTRPTRGEREVGTQGVVQIIPQSVSRGEGLEEQEAGGMVGHGSITDRQSEAYQTEGDESAR
jgi:hypothetical protein